MCDKMYDELLHISILCCAFAADFRLEKYGHNERKLRCTSHTEELAKALLLRIPS